MGKFDEVDGGVATAALELMAACGLAGRDAGVDRKENLKRALFVIDLAHGLAELVPEEISAAVKVAEIIRDRTQTGATH